jgi:hypothetical protein
MLKSISWAACIETLLSMAGIYYLVIGLMYYRKEIVALVKGKGLGSSREKATPGEADTGNKPADNTPEDFLLTERIVSELKVVIKKVMDDQVEREDLLGSIAHSLEGHGHLKNTPYAVAINHFIVFECETNYSVHLNEEEVMKLWGK